MANSTPEGGRVRLDKWLWAARFYKTRSLSAEEIDKGRVRVNGAPVKPAREVRVGDVVELRSGSVQRTLVVRALSGVRAPATAAALLYEETAESVAQRLAAAGGGAWHPNRPRASPRADPANATAANSTPGRSRPRNGTTAGAPL